MAARVELGGAPALQALSIRAKRFAASDALPRAVEDALTSMAPVAKEAVSAGAERLPTSGGLARRVGRTGLTAKTFRAPNAVGIRLKAEANVLKDPAAVNRGRVRRPTYGHKPWVIQIVRPGFFSDPLTELRPEVRQRLIAAKREAIAKF